MRNSDKANRHYNRYQILIEQQSPEDPKSVAETDVTTPSVPQRRVSAAGATPPPEMIQQVKQQLQQKINDNPGAQTGRPTTQMNTSIRRPVPSSPAKTSTPGWD